MSAADAPYSAEAIEALMVEAFTPGRAARSKEYKHGTRALLNNRLAGVPLPFIPYTLGTAAADAYLAGQDEGRAIVDRERSDRSKTGAKP